MGTWTGHWYTSLQHDEHDEYDRFWGTLFQISDNPYDLHAVGVMSQGPLMQIEPFTVNVQKTTRVHLKFIHPNQL